jgi:hypothetical protein
MKSCLNVHEGVRRDVAALPRIDTPSVRSLRRRYSKVLADESPRIVLRLVSSLLEGAGWAERVVAWEILAAHEGAFGLLNDRGAALEMPGTHCASAACCAAIRRTWLSRPCRGHSGSWPNRIRRPSKRFF